MATARLVVDANKAASKQALKAISTVLDGLSQLRRLKAEQDMMMNGDDGTQAALEYGLPNAVAGSAICNIVGTALTAIDVAQVQALSKLDQG